MTLAYVWPRQFAGSLRRTWKTTRRQLVPSPISHGELAISRRQQAHVYGGQKVAGAWDGGCPLYHACHLLLHQHCFAEGVDYKLPIPPRSVSKRTWISPNPPRSASYIISEYKWMHINRAIRAFVWQVGKSNSADLDGTRRGGFGPKLDANEVVGRSQLTINE